ncbi:MAG: uL15 family ribosomal protein [Corallococcus sp.]|nr:uL15 family ribosomal protein [Corallococcus sp.]MCM1359084.1 uL15 family ribosomal protein [Corallococcus sp.]MCM1395073.1 uL15 family ribosomal protein [Corallococcus sp.]
MALNWSFKARLHNASDAMKKRYFLLLDELATYKGVKTSESWDKVRVYIGRQTYGAMTFRGKTLCLAIALNPADYAESKYVFDDISEVARFANTPMLVRLSSDRQVKYLRELLETLFDGVDRVDGEKVKEREIPFYEKETLVEMALIKVYSGKKKAALEEDDEPAPVPVKKEEPKAKPETKAAVAATTVPSRYDVPQSVKSNPKGIINIGAINNNFDAGATVTPQALKDKGILGEYVNCLKVLAGGNLDKPLTIAASAFSREAKDAIASAGGTVVLIPIVK